MADYTNMTADEMEAEIRACHALLNDSDHTVIQVLEGLCDCGSATAIANYLRDLPADVQSLIAARKGYRQTIEELTEALDNIDY